MGSHRHICRTLILSLQDSRPQSGERLVTLPRFSEVERLRIKNLDIFISRYPWTRWSVLTTLRVPVTTYPFSKHWTLNPQDQYVNHSHRCDCCVSTYLHTPSSSLGKFSIQRSIALQLLGPHPNRRHRSTKYSLWSCTPDNQCKDGDGVQ